ncbi:MAG: hypothetical protein WCG31_07395 [Deltaproteobacteria bacterium]
MTNHVHFVAVPYSETSLARGFGEAHRRYTRMKNFTQGVRRYLFQGRFSSRVFDGKYLLAAVRYVQLNPVRARYDGPLLKAVLQAGYRPKVLQLEVNPEFPPH